jgi:long-chain acyl-CoA synthetase
MHAQQPAGSSVDGHTDQITQWKNQLLELTTFRIFDGSPISQSASVSQEQSRCEPKETLRLVSFYDDIGQYGQAVAFVLEDGETVSYASAAAEADSFSSRLSGRELVFILASNTLESVVGYLGCLRSKTPAAMLARTIHPDLLANLVKVYDPRYVWLPRELVERFDGAKELSSYRSYVLLERAAGPAELHKDLALLMTTSGSTGSSKFVRLSYDNIEANTDSIAEYLGIRTDDRAMTILPMHYVFGLSVINSHLKAGAAVVLTGASIMEKRFWDLLKQQKITSISGVPYTYELLKRLEWNRTQLPSLKVMTQAGGKLSAALVTDYAKQCAAKGIRFYVMYGAAEATARMSYLPPEIALQKPTSIGKAIPGGEFWLEDESGTKITQPEVAGELIYRGRNVCLGYAQSRADLSLGDERQGVLRTGDLAKRDAEGMYSIVGRKSRFIKLFGNRVNLEELEQLIRASGIDCACAGEDDKLRIYITAAERKGEVVPFVEELTGMRNSGATAIVIDKIPRNEAGKILYVELP